jgi:hypothetical protein
VPSRRFAPGDPVVYRKLKASPRPGPRAEEIVPTPRGEDYVYEVDKFWTVVEQRDDNTIVLLTRTGKRHVVPCDDPHLRRASWWERWRFASRFPKLPGTPTSDSACASSGG